MASSVDDVDSSPSKWKFWQWKHVYFMILLPSASSSLVAPSDGFPLCDVGSLSDKKAIHYARVMYSTGHGIPLALA